MRVLNRAFDYPLKPEENASAILAGGIMQHGYQCGMIWGAAFAAGAQIYRLYSSEPQAEVLAILASQKIVESFRTQNKHINCLEITEIDKSSTTMQMITFFLIKGGTIGCMRMAARYAKLAFDEINSALAEKPDEVPSSPVCCTAFLAQKIGLTDMQTVMAAGLAGGIGLCGGACGALGTASWNIGLNRLKEENGKISFKDPKAAELIERFLKFTDFKFECPEIVGRKFKNINDHAEYIKNGGCEKLINLLAQS